MRTLTKLNINARSTVRGIMDQKLFMQACLDVRITSDVTQQLFARLPDIVLRYEALVAVREAVRPVEGEEVSDELGE